MDQEERRRAHLRAWWSHRQGLDGTLLGAAVAATESFVRDEPGDARAFSLDSPKSRVPRVAELRG